MELAWILAVAVALGADAFSMALAIGLAGIRKNMIIRLSLIIAVFHIVMPLAGIVLGQTLGTILGQYATVIGALVLIVLGARMLYRVYRPVTESYSFRDAREAFNQQNIKKISGLKGFGIYILAASVSLDALSVGFTLGTIRTDVFMTVIIMGLTAGLMTGLGLVLGRIMGTRLGDKAELLGGLALFAIGVKLLI